MKKHRNIINRTMPRFTCYATEPHSLIGLGINDVIGTSND